MKNENHSHVVALIMRAGYVLPQVEKIVGSGMPLTTALVAFGPNEDGLVVRPTIAVGIMDRSIDLEPSVIKAAIRLLNEKYSTSNNYVFWLDSMWSSGPDNAEPILLESLPATDSPPQPWELADVNLIFKILKKHYYSPASADVAPNRLGALLEAIDGFKSEQVFELEGYKFTIPQGLLFMCGRILISELSESRDQLWGTPYSVSNAMANLARSNSFMPEVIFDPFMGMGDTLLTAAISLPKFKQLVGFDINSQAVSAAKMSLNSGQEYANGIVLSKENVTLDQTNSFDSEWPESDLIITAPPLALHLSEPYLGSAFVTREGDIAIFDKALQSLKPGGRLVICTTRGWTFKGNDSAKLRKMFTQRNDVQVSAIIGLPGGVLPYTQIPLCLVMIEKSSKRETLVADLGADWQEQLKLGSPLLNKLASI